MDNKTKRIKSKTGVNPAAMREAKAAKARGLNRKMEMTPLTKKTAARKPRATRVGTPVALPQRPSRKPAAVISERATTPRFPGQGPMARMSQQAVGKPKATKKATAQKPKATPKPKITRKPITERQYLDVPNMTPAEKAAYLERLKRGYY